MTDAPIIAASDLKVNLGCGTDIRPGWVNLDKVNLPGVDIVHDLAAGPLPFPSESCSEICCKDVLEHFNYIPFLREIHRILREGGIVRVRVPHFTSSYAYCDPTHRNLFSAGTFTYFSSGHGRNYYVDFSFSRITVKILFQKLWLYPYNYMLEPLVNISAQTQGIYEASPVRVFPAATISAVLKK
jgi:SAM-dependent methyltransferase